jgi:hypothetical protein
MPAHSANLASSVCRACHRLLIRIYVLNTNTEPQTYHYDNNDICFSYERSMPLDSALMA